MHLVRLSRSDGRGCSHSVECVCCFTSMIQIQNDNQRGFCDVASHPNDTAVCCHEDRLAVSRSQKEHVDLKCLQHCPQRMRGILATAPIPITHTPIIITS